MLPCLKLDRKKTLLFHQSYILFKNAGNQTLTKEKYFEKSTILLNYWKDLKFNEKGLLVKATNCVEQIVLPKQIKKFVFEDLHNKMGHMYNYVKIVSIGRRVN